MESSGIRHFVSAEHMALSGSVQRQNQDKLYIMKLSDWSVVEIIVLW